MELRHLRSFVYVAETLSFSVAASYCCVTQSAVSQHIKALEGELGCKLLIRTSHDIMLTESGETLLPRAKEILKQTEDCKEHIHALNNCITGELHIGVGSFIAPYVRVAALTFMKRYPNVRMYEDLLKFPVIMPDVGERELDTCQQYIQRDLKKLNTKCVISDPEEALAVIEETQWITFAPKLYLKNHPTLVAKPIVSLEQNLMSNAHYMQDVPMKRSAQLFLDIIKEEAIPYIASLEETM